MMLLYADSLWNLLWIIPFFLLLLFLAASRFTRTRQALFSSARAAADFLNVHHALRTFRYALLFLAILLAVLAASGPAWGRRVLPDAGPGRDLMILFDVSRSMLSDDVKPDRLTQGKWLVRELVRTNPADRFGLIAFAGNAFLLCPLTIDKTSFLQLSDSLDTDTIPLGGTNLQVALEAAVRAFEGAQGAHKAVVVVTDGDELTGNAAGVLKELADAGIPLFIAGVGDPANPSVIRIRKEDGTSAILTDPEGNTVRSPLNEPLLASLAEKTHGIYIRSTAADPGVDEINRAISRLDRRKADGTGLSLTRPIERPGTLFAVSLFLLLLFLCLSEVRKDAHPRASGGNAGKKAILFLVGFVGLSVMPLHADPAPSEPQAVLSEAADGSESGEASGDGEKTPVFWFNAGVRAQNAQEYEKAAAAYEKAVALGGTPETRAGSFQNLGILKHLDARKSFSEANSMLQAQKLSEAERSVDESLARLTDAEALYRESFRYAAQIGRTGEIARNQQILLRERKEAEDLKKQIEELKKLQEEARKRAEKALKDQQDQQKQDQDKKQDQQQGRQGQDQKQQDQQQGRQGQDQKQQDQQQGQQDQQQGQQDQKQDPRSSEGQESKSAQESAKDAADAAEQLEKKAGEMSQSRLEEQAKRAGDELRQAMDRQAEGDDRQAEEHLKNAVRMLGGKEDGGEKSEKPQDSDGEKQSGEPKDQDKQGQGKETPEKKQDGAEQEPAGKPSSPAPAKAGAGSKEEDRAIDPAQADAILNAMEQDEKELRDMIKEMQKRTKPQREPAKNW